MSENLPLPRPVVASNLLHKFIVDYYRLDTADTGIPLATQLTPLVSGLPNTYAYLPSTLPAGISRRIISNSAGISMPSNDVIIANAGSYTHNITIACSVALGITSLVAVNVVEVLGVTLANVRGDITQTSNVTSNGTNILLTFTASHAANTTLKLQFLGYNINDGSDPSLKIKSLTWNISQN